MSDMEVKPMAEPAPVGASLSQWQRVTNTFTAPSKTFDDIKKGNRSWWLPFVIMVLASYVLFGAITMKVGWAQVAENAIHLNPKAEEKLSQVGVFCITPRKGSIRIKLLRNLLAGVPNPSVPV